MGEDRQQGSRANYASENEPPSSSRPPSGELLERLSKHAPKEPRYKLLGEVARGGMGAILRVWDEDLQRPLAMKVVLGKAEPQGDTPAVDQRTLGRFLDEAQVTGQLDHPGIVPVHELGLDDNGQVYFTMKLVKGEDLAVIFDRVAEREPGWTLTRALEVLLRICDAMAFAHDRRVVHRDLKPSNVMVGRFGEVYVMDWGLARVLDQEDGADIRPVAGPPATVVHAEARPHGSPESSEESEEVEAVESALLTRDGDVLGTPYYMPPEQGRGQLERIGPASDVYSLGAMLYHLLTGNMPYAWPGERTSPLNILDRLLKGPPPPVVELAPGTPPELVAICEKAMAREPEERYVDMQEFARDLRAFLDQRVVLAYRTGAVVELKKWVRRNRPTAASLAALVLAVAGAGFALAYVEYRRSAEKDEAAARQQSLTDSSLARDLLQRADELYPIHVDTLPAQEAWVGEAHELLSRRPLRTLEFGELRDIGTPVDPAVAESVEVSNLSEMARRFANQLTGANENLARGDLSPEERRVYESIVATLEYTIPQLERRARRAEFELERGSDRSFESPEAGREHARLAALLHNLDRIEHPEFGALASIERRMADARRLDTVTTSFEAEWDAARRSIHDAELCPAYIGLPEPLPSVPGLVPLRRNADTGLWEFWHVLSGQRPGWSEESGWRITPETGLVLVLLPGVTRYFGAQGSEPGEPHYDPVAHMAEGPPRRATLAPFFLSKYEMTQAQWLRATGEVPSELFPGDSATNSRPAQRIGWTHPVETVSHEEVTRVLTRWNLTLPTEFQWEAAARAGTEGRFHTGDSIADLAGKTNLWDDPRGAAQPSVDGPGWSDGTLLHAPVGSFPPNPYGLHDLYGNVSELALDWYCQDLRERSVGRLAPETGELRPAIYRLKHTYRGGSWKDEPYHARVTYRAGVMPGTKDEDLGLRPALLLPRR